MKRKILLINNCSILCFFFSSFSLLGIPIIDAEDKISKASYIISIMFWAGLFSGIIFQLISYFIWNKMDDEKKKKYRNRKLLIPFIAFVILFFVFFIFWNKSVVLISVDLALTLFSIEFYFYFKRRYSV